MLAAQVFDPLPRREEDEDEDGKDVDGSSDTEDLEDGKGTGGVLSTVNSGGPKSSITSLESQSSVRNPAATLGRFRYWAKATHWHPWMTSFMPFGLETPQFL